MVRRGSVKEVVLSKFFKHEEDLAKGRGPSSLGEKLKHRQESGNVQGMLETMNGPFPLTLRFGRVYWSLSELVMLRLVRKIPFVCL